MNPPIRFSAALFTGGGMFPLPVAANVILPPGPRWMPENKF